MKSTRYRVKAPSRHAYRSLRGRAGAPGVRTDGREASLVLIEEHLTVNVEIPDPSFRKSWAAGRLLDGWNSPTAGFSLGSNEFGGNFVVKLQPFKAGGFELSCRSLDLEKIGAAMAGVRRFGKRERPEVPDALNLQKAASRAKRRVRHLTKNMGASHLVTFTRREAEISGYWTPDDWGKAWDRLRRLLVKAKGEFPYVAVLEKHKKGNYHLHVAWAEAPGQKVPLNLVRPLWWAVLGGRGAGNVDAQYIKVRSGLERSDRVAKYISKYTSKHFEEDSRFNKKRYWASRQTMEDVRRYILGSHTLSDALSAVQSMHGLNMADYTRQGKHGLEFDGFYPFPDGSGFWLTYIPEKHGGAPPPF